jgi:hypothetical protein
MFIVETVQGVVIASGKTLVLAHENAITYMRNHREIREAFIDGPDGTFIIRRPKLMNMYLPVENIAMHHAAKAARQVIDWNHRRARAARTES